MPVSSESEIRSHFPALERVHSGYPVAYFDGPGGTQVPRPVVEAMADYLYHHNANTDWAYPSSVETNAMVDRARAVMADFLNASPAEIVFGANMTTLAFHLSAALAARFGPDDEIVVTELDHHANIGPWRRLARKTGATVRMAKMMPESGQLDWQHLERLISRRTRLVAIGAASNALGTVNDVARVVGLAHAVGALVFVDAVHYAPHGLIDVREWDCDLLACSAYKFYGPHIGVLYGRLDLLESLDFPKIEPAHDEPPEKAETGTPNFEGMAGAAAAVDFLASLAGGGDRRSRLRVVYDELHARGNCLLEQLWQGLASIQCVRLFGPPPHADRTPTIAFAVDGVSSLEVSRRLASLGVFVSHGDFYASTVVERLGLAKEGVVRAGCACYTTPEEIERLVRGVREIAAGTASAQAG